MDYTVHGILQARILEWVAFLFFRGSFQPWDWNPGVPHWRQILYQLSHKGSTRIPGWVAYPFSSRSSWLRKVTKIKCKERILKASREKQQVTYKGNPIHLTVDLSTETLKARREWQDILKVQKGENLPLRYTPHGKDLIQNWWRNKKLYKQAKIKRI